MFWPWPVSASVRPPGDPPVRDAGIEAERPQIIFVAKAYDDAVRERKTLTKNDGNF
ncbi:MAG: hypothetical protein HYZ50_03660 [Deltaproteobacteria bacterium]|nr:hypothetical protein [Deltaproteobacteria bacterium]